MTLNTHDVGLVNTLEFLLEHHKDNSKGIEPIIKLRLTIRQNKTDPPDEVQNQASTNLRLSARNLTTCGDKNQLLFHRENLDVLKHTTHNVQYTTKFCEIGENKGRNI